MKNWERKKLGDICGFVRGPFGGSLKKTFSNPKVMQYMNNNMLFTTNLMI
jgi:hypothetical protein